MSKAKAKRVTQEAGKPTAGEWDGSHGIMWYKGKEHGAIDSGYIPVFSHLKGGGDLTICTVHCTIAAYENEYIANANLIAAGPNMLRALKGILGLCDAQGRLEAMGNSDQLRAARAAVAKAMGEKVNE